MCRDILNTCIRNTEEAEKAGQPAKSDAGSGRGQGKGVWLMIEESELAKSFRKDDKKKVEAHVPDASLQIILCQSVADMFFLFFPTEKYQRRVGQRHRVQVRVGRASFALTVFISCAPRSGPNGRFADTLADSTAISGGSNRGH